MSNTPKKTIIVTSSSSAPAGAAAKKKEMPVKIGLLLNFGQEKRGDCRSSCCW
ncbi:hypothetical protein ACQ86N_06545 [Puia sp. P3]|uniref:hypothetical protein n=1 Tax=Puia sp. P3 TaxID=3423952 RepID=UPI003D66E2C6